MAARYKITNDGHVFTTVITDTLTGQTIPVSSFTLDCSVEDKHTAEVLLRIPAQYFALDVHADGCQVVAGDTTHPPSQGKALLDAMAQRTVPEVINITLNIVVDDGGIDAEELADTLSESLRQFMRVNHISRRATVLLRK